MIDETYAVFGAWDFDRPKRENLDRLRQQNFIGAKSANWLRDVAKVLNRRFDPEGRDRPLVELAKHGLALEEWKPLLLWHMTRDEFLVRDFLESWLFGAYDSGAFRVSTDDVETYLSDIAKRGGTTEHVWSPVTTKRVAASLLKMGVDFGLLRGSIRREFGSFHLPDRTFIYLLHTLRDEKLSAARLIASPAWRLFLMRPTDVERELLRLHQYRKVEYQVAGTLAELSLPCGSAREYAERMLA